MLAERESGLDLHGEERLSGRNGKLWGNGGEASPWISQAPLPTMNLRKSLCNKPGGGHYAHVADEHTEVPSCKVPTSSHRALVATELSSGVGTHACGEEEETQVGLQMLVILS